MKPYRSSASQINTFELCPRKWAWAKLDKIQGPPNKYAVFGLRVHKILEGWFRDRTPPPNTAHGIVARNILGHLPPPQTPGITVERQIALTLSGVPFKGFVDLSILDREVPLVSDHKTCGNFAYVLTPETMLNDVQVALYGLDAMFLTETRKVEVQWTYGTRDGRKSLPVRRIVSYDDIRPRLDKIAYTAGTIKEIYEAEVSASEVPYDAARCDAFGGCPYESLCDLSARERIQSIMSQKEEGNAFLDKLRAKKGKTPAPKTHPPAVAAAGTPEVNPPPPAEAKADPPPATEPEKKKRTRRKAAPAALDKVAEAAAKIPAAMAKASEAAAKVTGPTIAPAPTPIMPGDHDAVPMHVVRLLLDTYRQGFKDGVEHG